MSDSRSVQPELLDELAPDHPDALRNRRDLRMINLLQGNFRWIAKQLARYMQPGEAVIEPGAGQGDLAYAVHNCGILRKGSPCWTGLDLWPRPADWPVAWDWKQEDLLAFSSYADYPVFVTNLILHQFEADALRNLGESLCKGVRVIIASETLRRPRAYFGLRCLWPLLNHVSKHDARVSLDAGFHGRELPTLLGLRESEWQINITESLLGTYRMVAIRVEGSSQGRDQGKHA